MTKVMGNVSSNLLQTAQEILLDKIVIIPDFPKVGIRYLDFYRTFDQYAEVRSAVIECFKERYSETKIDAIVGIANGGLSLASAFAYALNVPLHPVRKAGDTVYGAIEASVGMVYAERKLSLATDIIKPNSNVVLVDDTIATGGTFNGAIELLNKLEVNIIEIATVFETVSKQGRNNVAPVPVFSILARDNF
ncbi:hypothetical protein JNUCC31_17940 [Paenibacillus sp. JNUCC31]|uniref:phosphoribosyltransferase family protein n=1 Tax=Paenibacillus sp. JNUCC-31 TaxID=2777983 RepID=UPI00177C3096|nr:phosphoribosyltransferase family protein [Paenibacillus sp. JNUCC-31]QOS76723.1 hypothetical protein JNUCC31_17940 [Paenibacillus sp. JNUCC-31]